jgi:hypothetical protein
LLFSAFVLPGQAAESRARTGGAAQPDTSLVYSAADLYSMAEAFGPAGRQAYIEARLTFDVVWPLVYTFFLVASISWLAGRAFRPGSRWRLLNLLPILAILLDFLENFAAVIVMARFPLTTPVIDFAAPLFTLLKWLCVGGSFVALVGTGLAAVWRQMSRKLGQTS